ncbi:MAG: class I SAM-dependent RNA methyltransferase [Flavobacteriales bacterium]|nr:class I SAM-dependent RNA methyltransferase [Flavobacteriales bacterium]
MEKPDVHFQMIAQTLFGLEGVLANELEGIGATDVVTHNRAVRFTGDQACMYKANLCLHTALRILVPIDTFAVRGEQELYQVIRAMPWEDHLDAEDTLAVHCTLNTDLFNHSQYLALKTKDAICDRFREKTGKRPSVDVELPTLRIFLHVHGDRCTVSLDSSGNTLHERGYRDQTNLAPINEVLAAGMVLLSGWDRRSPFVDPMCGSGTILIEAAMIALRIPPNHDRAQFGFERWKDFDADLWKQTYNEALAKVLTTGPPIIGGEISPNVARKAIANIHNAGLEDHISISTSAFADLEVPDGAGVLIINPPYGERMDKEADIHAFYKMIGDTLKKKWAGWTAWIITSNMEAAKHVKLTPKPKIKLYNGALDCRFLRYELYAGSRRREDMEVQ